MKDDCDKSLRGSAGQFFVAGELCRRGWVAVVTMGNCPNTDILCSDVHGNQFVHIQVKTFRPGKRTCSVGRKAEKDYGGRFFWILAGVPVPSSRDSINYFIIPSNEMATRVKASFDMWRSTPGRQGQQHDPDNTIRTVAIPPHKCRDGWDISDYENRWDLIEAKLNPMKNQTTA